MESTTPRERRREETRAEILAAAWEIARRAGLAAISMRELGRAVGLKAQSLYAYFPSKGALYDAMFRQGHEQLAAVTAAWPADLDGQPDPRTAFAELSKEFVRFCAADPVRYQLLFQRVIPDWEPSAASYALAVTQLGHLERAITTLGLDAVRDRDMWTAIVTGITSQQHSNEPGGDRWVRLVDDAVDMFFDFHRLPPRGGPR
jgi:AcrR family transcriptional regulator